MSLGRVPNPNDGGDYETYWLRRKLQESITHLRDIEDYYRFLGGRPEGFNMIRADRARQLYELINEDFVYGKTTIPTRIELMEELEILRSTTEDAKDTESVDQPQTGWDLGR